MQIHKKKDHCRARVPVGRGDLAEDEGVMPAVSPLFYRNKANLFPPAEVMEAAHSYGKVEMGPKSALGSIGVSPGIVLA